MKVKGTRILSLLLAAAMLCWLLSRVDWPATEHYLQRLGARAPLVLLPYLFVVACDTFGWQASFETPRRMSVYMLWCIRVATDALANSLPAGMAVGETMKALLLRRVFGMPIADATANVLVSKFLLAIAQVIFLALGVALSARELARHSQSLIGRPGLEWFGALAALVFLAVLVSLAILVQRAVLARLLARLRDVASPGWRARLARWEAPLARVDYGLRVVARMPPRQMVRSVAFFLVGWLCLGIENWVILSLLSPGVSVANAVSMEAVVSIVRVLFFFIPSAFGAQEVSYYALFKVYDVPAAESLAAAFMLTKRAKELCFTALGYLLLSWLPARVGEVHGPLPQ
jgi:glycosyltransferase 2 family protein